MDKYLKQTKHGYNRRGKNQHPLYTIWKSMMFRCNNPKSTSYKNYGGRGIQVCDRWHDVKSFIDDMFPTYQKGLTIDRINVNGDYSPENCRWVTYSTNLKNKRNKSDRQSDVDFVSFNKQSNKWYVLSYFDTQEKAEQFAINNHKQLFNISYCN